MKVKSVFFSLFVVAAFIGFVSVGVTHALSFLDWGATWFRFKFLKPERKVLLLLVSFMKKINPIPTMKRRLQLIFTSISIS